MDEDTSVSLALMRVNFDMGFDIEFDNVWHVGHGAVPKKDEEKVKVLIVTLHSFIDQHFCSKLLQISF